jgi:hypothetical protein
MRFLDGGPFKSIQWGQSLVTTQTTTQTGLSQRGYLQNWLKGMVGPGGLEPLTSSVSTYHRNEIQELRPYRAASPQSLYLFHR